jgi:ribose 5-phosphate isomerase A
MNGGGGALTREKIVADLAERFVCIADPRSWSSGSAAFPAGGGGADGGGADRPPVHEARRPAGAARRRGHRQRWPHPRYPPAIADPAAIAEVSQWPGVVCCGIFARNRRRSAFGTAEGVRTMRLIAAGRFAKA